MSELSRDDLRAAWQRLAGRNDWRLVDDEDRFLDQVAHEYTEFAKAETTSGRIEVAVWRAYSMVLYQGLEQRDERAAGELRAALRRIALKRRCPEQDVEDIVQQVLVRVFTRLSTLTSPQGLLSWVNLALASTLRDFYKRRQDVPLESDADESAYDVPDPIDVAEAVAQQLVGQDLLSILRAALPNDLELLMIVRTVIGDDKPRDVALDLGLPQHRPIVAKCRALKRLRENPACLAALRAYLV